MKDNILPLIQIGNISPPFGHYYGAAHMPIPLLSVVTFSSVVFSMFETEGKNMADENLNPSAFLKQVLGIRLVLFVSLISSFLKHWVIISFWHVQ